MTHLETQAAAEAGRRAARVKAAPAAPRVKQLLPVHHLHPYAYTADHPAHVAAAYIAAAEARYGGAAGRPLPSYVGPPGRGAWDGYVGPYPGHAGGRGGVRQAAAPLAAAALKGAHTQVRRLPLPVFRYRRLLDTGSL